MLCIFIISVRLFIHEFVLTELKRTYYQIILIFLSPSVLLLYIVLKLIWIEFNMLNEINEIEIMTIVSFLEYQKKYSGFNSSVGHIHLSKNFRMHGQSYSCDV